MKENERVSFYLDTIYVHKNDIYRIALNSVRNDYIAEELMQTVLAKAWKALDSLQYPEKAWYWLKTITENAICDYLRDKTVYVSQEDRNLFDSFADVEELLDIERDIEYALVVKEDVARVFKALEYLDVRYQNIIRMHLIGNVTLKDIAEASDANYGSIRVMYSRGMKKLREIYWELEKGGKPNGQK